MEITLLFKVIHHNISYNLKEPIFNSKNHSNINMTKIKKPINTIIRDYFRPFVTINLIFMYTHIKFRFLYLF